jgi:ribosomal protein S18 acetylase RimI-like enzyme
MLSVVYDIPESELRYWDIFTEEVKGNGYFPIENYHPKHRGNFYCYIRFNWKILGFGAIRGWNEKWEDKCIGLVISPKYRGRGLGLLLMNFMEAHARIMNVKRLRLHVNINNIPAIRLYEKLGYEFGEETREDGEWIGYKEL